jgi:parvulin-like peptidyl-prolyl isomerase
MTAMLIFATVNGTPIEIPEAMRILWMEPSDFARPVVESILLRQYAAAIGARVTNQELQVASEEMRYAHGTESLEKLKQWTRENHQSFESIEYWLESKLLRNKIMARFTEDEIAAYFAEHRLDFEEVVLYSCRVETAGKAEELIELIREGDSFLAIAAAHSTDGYTAEKGGYVGSLTRSDVEPDLESILFGAPVGQPVGPVKTKEGYNIFWVKDQVRPTLDQMRDTIREQLVTELLSKLSGSAQIEFPCVTVAASSAHR